MVVPGSSSSRTASEMESMDRLTAYHEAGHAVMAQLCGQYIVKVEIIGSGDLSGTCSSLRFRGEPAIGEDPAMPTAAVEARILCLCAGMAAENMAGGCTASQDGGGDLDEAVRLALRLVDDCEAVMPYLQRASEFAEEILGRHWDAVETLATSLLARKSIAGEEVRELLAPVLGDQ